MLKQRLITAIILIPLFVLCILKLSPKGFGLLTWFFVILGAWEWSSLMQIQGMFKRAIYPFLISFCAALSLYLTTDLVLCIALIGWVIAFILVLAYPRLNSLWGSSLIVRSIMGLVVLIPTFRALNFIRDTEIFGHNHGRYVLLFLFVLIWGADSGAYFAGKKFGKNKLAERVSPGKTWEGLSGALLTTIILAPGLYYLFPTPRPAMWALIVLSVITTLFSVLGDLFESMLKRNAGLKDSGYLIPGHGGLLDRIDSLTAAAPVFALGCLLVVKIFH